MSDPEAATIARRHDRPSSPAVGARHAFGATVPEPTDRKRNRQITFSGGYVVAAIAIVWLVQALLARPSRPRDLPYSELVSLIRSGRVVRVEVSDRALIAELGATKPTAPEMVRAARLPRIDDGALVRELEERHLTVAGRFEESSPWSALFFNWILPIGGLALLYSWSIRRVGRNVGPLSFGKSRAKIHESAEANRTTFADVAGIDEAVRSWSRSSTFSRRPPAIQRSGRTFPRACCWSGRRARARPCWRARSPARPRCPSSPSPDRSSSRCSSASARRACAICSSRPRSARPCIVFIDEIDAIGRSRGGLGVMATHDEREQTLNQLLAEMDGFDPSAGVVLMAATNRPEILDPALLRAGRFDRQVLVDRPDLRGRAGHPARARAQGARSAAPSISMLVAQRTPGMVGADLANVVNEAALAAARRQASEVEQRDFEEAIDRIQLGLRKRGRAMNDDEKRRVAYHEAGHALVALSVGHADPVHRVTIIPRSIGALGATLQLPTEDRYLVTRDELLDRLCVLLAGRAAEELVFGDVSTGAAGRSRARHRDGAADGLPLRYERAPRRPDLRAPGGARFLELPEARGAASATSARRRRAPSTPRCARCSRPNGCAPPRSSSGGARSSRRSPNG